MRSHLRSSIDLIADELITRIAGLPGSTFPSNSCFSQRASFHDGPKATFISFPKDFVSWSVHWDNSTMHLSTQFTNHNDLRSLSITKINYNVYKTRNVIKTIGLRAIELTRNLNSSISFTKSCILNILFLFTTFTILYSHKTYIPYTNGYHI